MIEQRIWQNNFLAGKAKGGYIWEVDSLVEDEHKEGLFFYIQILVSGSSRLRRILRWLRREINT